MSAAATQFKLGLLTLIALAAALVVVFALGWRTGESDVVRYHTYFDETVQGLEVGSPVKYRGVPIGNVAAIQIAPDTQHVDVSLALRAGDATRLRLANVAEGVRTQLGTQGITGVKFVDIDFFDPKTNPPSKLTFEPPENYIPARPSLMKGLEGNLEIVSQRLPELIEVMIGMLQRADTMLGDLDQQHIPKQIATSLEGINGAIGDMRRLLQHIDRARLPDKTAASIESLSQAIAKVNRVLDGLASDGGLLASTQRVTDSVGDVGRSMNGSATQLERTLRDLDEAAVVLRGLLEAIDRDPDMLLKGRAREKRP